MLRVQRDSQQSLCSTVSRIVFRGGLPMSLSSHLSELKKKHHLLDEQVEQAQRSPGVDGLHVATLKKQKLRLKEEIERLSS